MARPIWSGVVTFGMVSIPVKLFTGTAANDISFNQLHKKCKSRIKYVKWCPVDDEAVDNDEIVKGYEYSKGKYVVLTEEDFEKLPLPSKHTIEIRQFVKMEDIDPVYYDQTYTLEPDEAGVKPWALFMKALEEKGMVGVAKIALRQKEHICALRPANGNLILETLYYPDEIRVDLDKKLPSVRVSEQELKMAETLVDLLAGKFDPADYKDEYRDALMEVIKAKLEGHEVVEAPPTPETKITDLMEALRASVEAAKQPEPKEHKKLPAAKRKKAG